MQVEIYDTTLRDGTQMEGISLSVEDKLKIARKLDELGVHYIEGGWPGSNPKDAEFFVRARSLSLRNAKLAAFGSTRRPGVRAEQDANLRALVDAGTPVVTIVGKAHLRHVTEILETTPEENLSMIADSVRYLRAHGLTVFFDAEHFFDGYFYDPEYALQCLRTAAQAGAECVVLCDTNGGTITSKVYQVVKEVVAQMPVRVGIHAHNGADLAVANSLAAVEAGATHVQGAVNGYGDMCGNANIISIIANLKLKMGIHVVTDEQLKKLTEVSRFVSEVANLPPNPRQPYVGSAAFAHKAGLHAAGVAKAPWSYQHIDPALVGNETRFLVSELSGSHGLLAKLREQGIEIDRQEARRILEQVKLMESKGYQYEGAEASLELLARRQRPGYEPPFELVDFMVVERRHHGPGERDMLSEAMVKVRVGDQVIHTAAEGNGPVNALDAAVRKALVQFYPSLEAVRLVDYKVRIIDPGQGTAASVRVLIESTDGQDSWTTVGASTDIIEASWLALADSLEYWLVKRGADRVS
ncbi:MAG: citramalate synthase [Dehalococcoidia bacterium]|jgi:2-isopropylmalate synthase|nr:citramalate synthase [Dehalococcoidia bacterium]